MSIFYLNPNDLPFVELYMSDFLQLGFYIKNEREGNNAIHGYNYQEDDGTNYIMLNLYFIGKHDIEDDVDKFVVWFNKCWEHEYFHLIGLSEEVMGYIGSGKCCIELEGDRQ